MRGTGMMMNMLGLRDYTVPLPRIAGRWQASPANRKLFVMALSETPWTRITFDPEVMGGKPCIRGMRVTVGTIVGLLAAGHDIASVLKLYPYLEEQDVRDALAYAAWRAEERSLPLRP
jgi:uncharacterized protein (DUF433 family)